MKVAAHHTKLALDVISDMLLHARFDQEEIEKEKRWFNTKWSRQEKQIRAVIDNTQGMYSDMQGYVGKALPTLSQLELPE